jgi:hypothetical protein
MEDDMKIRIVDNSGWEWGKDNNGGFYSFAEDFEIEGNRAVKGEHWNSSDFEYCEYCGIFGCRSCGEYRPSPLAEEIAEKGLENVELPEGVRARIL